MDESYITAYEGEEIDEKLSQIDNKVDKVEGKMLSDENYTSVDKERVGHLKTDGDGHKFLDNTGTYKDVIIAVEADNEESAIELSALNPNTIYYWSD